MPLEWLQRGLRLSKLPQHHQGLEVVRVEHMARSCAGCTKALQSGADVLVCGRRTAQRKLEETEHPECIALLLKSPQLSTESEASFTSLTSLLDSAHVSEDVSQPDQHSCLDQAMSDQLAHGLGLLRNLERTRPMTANQFDRHQLEKRMCKRIPVAHPQSLVTSGQEHVTRSVDLALKQQDQALALSIDSKSAEGIWACRPAIRSNNSRGTNSSMCQSSQASCTRPAASSVTSPAASARCTAVRACSRPLLRSPRVVQATDASRRSAATRASDSPACSVASVSSRIAISESPPR